MGWTEWFYKHEKASDAVPQAFGVTGLKHRHGSIHQEFLSDLRGAQGRKIYAEMRDNDPTIGALLNAIELMVRAVPWRFEPSPNDITGHYVAWTRQQWQSLTTGWSEILADMTQAFVFGFSVYEPVYRTENDGTIGLSHLAPRAAETITEWEIDSTGKWQAAIQRDPNTGKKIRLPRHRLVLICPRSYQQNPEGRSLLRNAYTSYYHIKRLQTIEAIAIERELNGIPVVYAPATALKDSTTKDKLDQIARDLKFNEQGGVVMPSDPFMDRQGNMTTMRQFEVKLLASEGTRAIDTSQVIQRYQQDMLRAVLADFLMLGSHKQGGSYALAVNKSDLFLRSLESYIDHIRHVIQHDILGRLWQLNGWSADMMPQLIAGSVRPVSLDELSGYINALSDAGIRLDDKPTNDYLRRAGHLPTIVEENI